MRHARQSSCAHSKIIRDLMQLSKVDVRLNQMNVFRIEIETSRNKNYERNGNKFVFKHVTITLNLL